MWPPAQLVKQYFDRTEIFNPGGLVGDLTLENILHHAPATRLDRKTGGYLRETTRGRWLIGRVRTELVFAIFAASPLERRP